LFTFIIGRRIVRRHVVLFLLIRLILLKAVPLLEQVTDWHTENIECQHGTSEQALGGDVGGGGDHGGDDEDDEQAYLWFFHMNRGVISPSRARKKSRIGI